MKGIQQNTVLDQPVNVGREGQAAIEVANMVMQVNATDDALAAVARARLRRASAVLRALDGAAASAKPDVSGVSDPSSGLSLGPRGEADHPRGSQKTAGPLPPWARKRQSQVGCVARQHSDEAPSALRAREPGPCA